MIFELYQHLIQFFLLNHADGSIFFLTTQMIPLLKKLPVNWIVMQIDKKRRSFKIRADEIIPVNGAIQEFLFGKFFVNSRRRKGGDILK